MAAVEVKGCVSKQMNKFGFDNKQDSLRITTNCLVLSIKIRC